MKTLHFLPLLLAASLLRPDPVLAQAGVAARAAAELIENLAKQGGKEAAETGARELAEFGGQRAVREMLEQVEKEGGQALVSTVTRQTEQHGWVALRALKGAPAPVIRAVDGVPADLAANSLRALAGDPVVMRKLAGEYGSVALETAAKHPGLAAPIGNRLGAEGLDLARKLSTEEALLLSRAGTRLGPLAPAERSAFLSLIRESPAKALAWIERHPKLIIAGSATTAVVLARKEIFGDGAKEGLLERAAGAFYRTFEKPINTALGVGAAGALLLGGYRVWQVRKSWRRRRAA